MESERMETEEVVIGVSEETSDIEDIEKFYDISLQLLAYHFSLQPFHRLCSRKILSSNMI